MTSRNFVIILMIVFQGSVGEATIGWNDKGSGSDIVLCSEDVGQTEIYDTFEARVRHKLQPTFPAHMESEVNQKTDYSGIEDLAEVLELARKVVGRLAALDPKLEDLLVENLLNVPSQIRFLADTKIVELEDYGQIGVSRGCELKQLIVQRTPYFPTDRRYTVALDHWRRLPLREKAVSLLHEILFQYARSWNDSLRTSEPIRYFNAVLLSGSLEQMTQAQYEDLRYRTFYWYY